MNVCPEHTESDLRIYLALVWPLREARTCG